MSDPEKLNTHGGDRGGGRPRLPEGEKKVAVPFKIPKGLLDALKRKAAIAQMPLSEYVIKLLEGK